MVQILSSSTKPINILGHWILELFLEADQLYVPQSRYPVHQLRLPERSCFRGRDEYGCSRSYDDQFAAYRSQGWNQSSRTLLHERRIRRHDRKVISSGTLQRRLSKLSVLCHRWPYGRGNRFTWGCRGSRRKSPHQKTAFTDNYFKSYRELKYDDDGKYSLKIFRSSFPIENLWSCLDQCSIFRRGLPMLHELSKPDISRVFRVVFCNNNVTMQMFSSTEDKNALDQCFKRGWLHATTDRYQTRYIFTNPLHQWFIEYYLGTNVVDSIPITDQDLAAFATNVIRQFSHQRLSSPREMGASDERRPMEAQFQDEFYHCCHKYSNGSLISFPGFTNASGRVDFYIPCREWGVELLRDGCGLENHASRFTGQGAYAKMKFDDYIILDFCTKRPQKMHPG